MKKYYVNREMTINVFQAYEIAVPDEVVAEGTKAIRDYCKDEGPDWRDDIEVESDRLVIEAD